VFLAVYVCIIQPKRRRVNSKVSVSHQAHGFAKRLHFVSGD
jgi:hypothetical protein